MAIATDYKYMKNSGKPPRFEEAFSFKHILNDTDSNTDFLRNSNPVNQKGDRVTAAIPNTNRAYAQAMNRFNTQGVSAGFDTILESHVICPRPRKAGKDKGGREVYSFDVLRGWKFKRIENNFAPPNCTKYEAVLVAQFGTDRTAVMSCMGSAGVVNHWDQGDNGAWF